MAGVNKAIIVGNVGKDPDVRSMQSGGSVASFSVATSKSWKDKATGEKKEQTDWHNVVVFNEHLVRVVEQYVHKGTKLYVEGEMRTRKYTDRDGIERYRTEVVLGAFKAQLIVLDRREGGAGAPADEAAYGTTPRSKGATTGRVDFDDEVPF
jgi:single-strand DNA-binding protein